MKLQNLEPKKLIVAGYNPSIRTDKKSVKQLLESIKQNGILYPILVDKNLNVIDGHRRLSCAKTLKLTVVPCLISDTKMSKDACYETINTTARKMSASEMIYVYVRGGKVPDSVEKRIKILQNIVGHKELKKMGDKFISISVMSQGNKIAKYCNEKSDAFVKKAILWIIQHKQSYQVRKAMEDKIFKSRLKQIIESNKPLTYK